MTKYDLREAIYAACLQSAQAMESSIKSISWFGKQHSATNTTDEKRAA